MYCWNCHQEISDNSKFCIHCGADLRQGAAPAAAQQPQAQSGAAYTAEPIQTGPAVTAQATPKKRFNWKAILLAVLVFIAARFIGQAVGKSMASSGSSKPSSSSSSKPQDDLSQAVANAQQDLITLHNVYVFPDQGDGYRVFVIVYYGSDNNITLEVPAYVDSLWLILRASNALCQDTDTLQVPILASSLYIPNVFTPDLETNNIFRAVATGITDFEIWIYDRRGDLVFHSTDINHGWDGTHQGRKCVQAAYAYKCRYIERANPSGYQSKTGTVVLLR